MRIALASTSPVSLPTFHAITTSNNEFVGLITKFDKSRGRGQRVSESDLIKTMTKLGAPIYRIKNQVDLEDILHQINPDLVITISFGMLIRKQLLDIPKHGWINLHFSLLPKYRGAAPVQRAILAGEMESGVTVFKLDEGMDTGPVYVSKPIQLGGKSYGEFMLNAAEIGSMAVMEAIDLIESGYVAKPQTGEASSAPKIDAAETQITMQMSAHEIISRILAFAPKPGAWLKFRGQRLKVLEATVRANERNLGVGRIINLNPLEIATVDSILHIGLVQAEGKRVMSAQEWLRGVRVNIGEIID